MQKNILDYCLKRVSWKSVFLLGMLLLFEVSIHPLTFGPDRKIHDPAVYRLDNPAYLSGDWYTNMAVESGVYTFYAKLINAWHVSPFNEETWRMLLYLASLIVLYVSMIKIGKIFSKSFWVIPIVAICHALLILVAPPIWLYGPFIQIDGGLAPRSIGMALSFLSLFFLLKSARFLPWVLLGVATFIHVSNSLIVFTLFFVAWFFVEWIWNDVFKKQYIFSFLKKSFLVLGVYLVSGGWFALYVAQLGREGFIEIPTEKFIWAWIYFRAPYMALPLMPWRARLLLALHCLTVVIGWYILRKRISIKNRKAIDLLGFVGTGAILYFFLFYFFAFVRPWFLGFEFYSIRVIYFTHFVAYLFAALLLGIWYRDWIIGRFFRVGTRMFQYALVGMVVFVLTSLFIFSSSGKKFLEQAPKNIRASWAYLSNSKDRTVGIPTSEVEKYLFMHPNPFLAPPNWYGSFRYLPSVVTFKSFGFTKKGMMEWFDRIDDVSHGELERLYESQTRSGRFEPVTLDWIRLYSRLTANDVIALSKKYHFTLFLTYSKQSYSFPIVVDDGEYRLYEVLKEK